MYKTSFYLEVKYSMNGFLSDMLLLDTIIVSSDETIHY